MSAKPPSYFAEGTPTRPYLVRALHEWCTDNGFTPYLAVFVDESVSVPREFVRNQQIVLNVSYDATSGLKMDNDFIVFKARFGGQARTIEVPMSRVLAIYASENGQGMSFPAPSAEGEEPDGPTATDVQEDDSTPFDDDPAPAAEPAPKARRSRKAKPAIGLAPVSTEDKPPSVAGQGDAEVPKPPEEPGPEGGGKRSRPALKRVK
jgi:stringent starvation protein B